MPRRPDPAASGDPDRWSQLGAEVPARPRRLRRTRVVLAALVGVAVVLTGLAYVGYRAGANASPVAVVRGWFADSADDTAALRAQFSGRQLYETNCALCHGPAGQGGQLSIRGPAFAPGGPLSELSFEERVAKTLRGRPLRGMPRWKGKLTEAEIRKIAAYTLILSGASPEPTVEGAP